MKRFINVLWVLSSFFLLVAVFACSKEEPVEEVPDPVLEAVEETLTVSYSGGQYTINYTLSNPVDGAIVEAASDDAWIGNFTYPQEGTVRFNVEENLSREERSGSVLLAYTMSGGNVIEERVYVVQLANTYDYMVEAASVTGQYYGDMYDEGSGIMNYYINMSDLPSESVGSAFPGATYYIFDIYTSQTPENKGKVALPEGVYVLGDGSDGTFAAGNSRWFITDDTGQGYAENAFFEEGSLTVTKKDGVYFYEADLTDMNGKTHRVTYSGSVQLADYSPVMSTLTSDYEADMEGAICDGEYYGDYFGTGTANWTVYIYQPGSLTGDYIKLELLTDPGFTPQAGFPTGTYTDSRDYSMNTYISGYSSYAYTIGSWLFVDGFSGGAPLTDGEIEIVENGDGTYTISIDCMDNLDPANRITASWTGVPELADVSEQAANRQWNGRMR